MTASSRDLALDLPLSGLHLIEASAGTGKTFTLTAWILRLLLETPAALPDLLAVTFTRAATAELRMRIRHRLRAAERWLAGAPQGESDELRQSVLIIEQAQARGLSREHLRARLQVALLRLDEASIFTIHGFCQRALSEFGFLAGTLNDDPLLEHPEDLWRQVAADLWRRASHADTEEYETLSSLWQTPDALAGDLPRLCDPARRLLPEAGESAAAAWLHRLRGEADALFERAVSERRRRTHDQLIGQAWHASARPPFAAALRRRWRWMLIDEFQDTDPRQWDIFRRVYQASSDPDAGLFLIGDPKQAIYRFRGGDLETYLTARAAVIERGGPGAVCSLDTNYRSCPAVLRAIDTMFGANSAPFGDARISYRPLHAARADAVTLSLDGCPAPGLTLHRLRPEAGGKFRRSGQADQAAAVRATVGGIVQVLERGRLRTKTGERAVLPGDIAILVRKNQQIDSIRRALARVGIAIASQSNDSVFASNAAADLRCLLRALTAPSDPDRLRTALSTRLLGWDAASIAALETDAAGQMHWLDRFEQAATIWQHQGPLPALLPFLGEVSPARLAEQGGRRLLTDALHLAEILQAEAPGQHGLHGLLRWFEQHCAAPPLHEEYRLRLDADTQAVHVMTLHKSKGLEYPIVFLPFAAFANAGRHGSPRFMRVRDALGHPACYVSKSGGDGADGPWLLRGASHAQWEREEKTADAEEELRLLYVGLTRAQSALHLVWGPSRAEDFNASALRWLLHDGQRGGSKKGEVKPDEIDARIDRLAAGSDGGIVVCDIPDAPPPVTVSAPPEAVEARCLVHGALPRPAGQHSFSSLRTHHRETLPARGADDETALPLGAGEDGRLAGPDFGNAVHDVLESVDFGMWRDAAPDRLPPQQTALLRQALRRRGLLLNDSADGPAVAQVGGLVARALNTALPGIGTLAELPPGQYVRELEFHFRLGAVRLPRLFEWLARHGYPRAYPSPRQEPVEGLMHGYVDLLYRDREGRHFVVDYKTNRLSDYASDALARAVADNDYDLQYLIYLVAVQRWLKLRFGDRYDAARQLGGAVYLFLRGLRPGDAVTGVHVDRPPQAVIDRLDRWFDGDGA